MSILKALPKMGHDVTGVVSKVERLVIPEWNIGSDSIILFSFFKKKIVTLQAKK